MGAGQVSGSNRSTRFAVVVPAETSRSTQVSDRGYGACSLGEEPILAGKTVAQLVKGRQSQKVIGDIKHYALNDQETGRNIGDVKMSRRVMRQTDLLAFEIAILESQPGMVMCSYNKVNGDWACENDYLLNQLLKKTWGFKGAVISDWNATHSTAKAALALVGRRAARRSG